MAFGPHQILVFKSLAIPRCCLQRGHHRRHAGSSGALGNSSRSYETLRPELSNTENTEYQSQAAAEFPGSSLQEFLTALALEEKNKRR